MSHDPSDNRSAENCHLIESPANTASERSEISEYARESTAPVTSAAQRQAARYAVMFPPMKSRAPRSRR